MAMFAVYSTRHFGICEGSLELIRMLFFSLADRISNFMKSEVRFLYARRRPVRDESVCVCADAKGHEIEKRAAAKPFSSNVRGSLQV